MKDYIVRGTAADDQVRFFARSGAFFRCLYERCCGGGQTEA